MRNNNPNNISEKGNTTEILQIRRELLQQVIDNANAFSKLAACDRTTVLYFLIEMFGP